MLQPNPSACPWLSMKFICIATIWLAPFAPDAALLWTESTSLTVTAAVRLLAGGISIELSLYALIDLFRIPWGCEEKVR